MTLALEQVGVSYSKRLALRPTSLRIEPKQLLGLIGPNGAGKSSLLKAIAGLVPCSGRVSWNGVPLTRLKPLQRARTVSYLPQAPAAHWPMNSEDIVALGRLPHRAFGQPESAEDRDAIDWAPGRCEATSFVGRSADELSGGEHARVLLARALAVRAPLLLVDEPIQSLDPYHQLQIMNVLRTYAGADTAVVAVLHDVALAARFCTRIVLLHEGEVVADGDPEAVLTVDTFERYYRVHPYVRRHDDQPVIVPWRRTSG
jgi:iron complex transport system ATP-binding protein